MRFCKNNKAAIAFILLALVNVGGLYIATENTDATRQDIIELRRCLALERAGVEAGKGKQLRDIAPECVPVFDASPDVTPKDNRKDAE